MSPAVTSQQETNAELTRLRNRDQLFRELTETMHEIFWMHDLTDMRLLYVSPSYERIWGRSLVDVYRDARDWTRAIHPDDAPMVERVFSEAIENCSSYQADFRITRPDGAVRWIHDRGHPICDADGVPYRFCGIAEDITDRRLIQNDLQSHRDRLQLAHAVAGIGTWDWDIQGGHAIRSEAYCEIFGIDRDSAFPSHDQWLERVHPDDREQAEATVQNALRHGGPYHNEYRVLRGDGTDHWVESRARVFMDDGGNAIRMVGAVVDVTDRKRTEEALRTYQNALESQVAMRTAALHASETRMRVLFEGIDDALLVFDRNGTVLDSNDVACRVLGCPREALIGRQIRTVAQGSKQLFEVPDESHNSTAARREGRLRTPDGGDTAVDVRLTHIEYGGTPAFLAVVRDMTEARQAEAERNKFQRQMMQAQKMESLGVLAGGIAHDFNNLLTAILGNAMLAASDLPTASPARGSLEEISRAAVRAADLCRQMLAYSGRGQFVIKPLNLNQLVGELGMLLESTVSKKATVELDLANDLPSVEGDDAQLSQVVMNLIINASEAMNKAPGTIRVTTRAVTCSAEFLTEAFAGAKLAAGSYVLLEIADTGCGMDTKTVQQIFDPYFSTKFTGRGLGLAAVQGIVRGHGGAIRVYSELGVGSTFKVLLPASTQQPDERVPIGNATFRGSGTILIVDDEEIVLKVAQRIVERLGFDVVTARNGRQAVEVFSQDPQAIACVLLDLTMPELDGDAAFRELRRIRSDIKVIMTSGYSQHDINRRGPISGLAGFVQKPFEVDELRAALATALRPESCTD